MTGWSTTEFLVKPSLFVGPLLLIQTKHRSGSKILKLLSHVSCSAGFSHRPICSVCLAHKSLDSPSGFRAALNQHGVDLTFLRDFVNFTSMKWNSGALLIWSIVVVEMTGNNKESSLTSLEGGCTVVVKRLIWLALILRYTVALNQCSEAQTLPRWNTSIHQTGNISVNSWDKARWIKTWSIFCCSCSFMSLSS